MRERTSAKSAPLKCSNKWFHLTAAHTREIDAKPLHSRGVYGKYRANYHGTKTYSRRGGPVESVC